MQRSFVKKNGGRRGRRIASTAAEKETGDKTSAANGKPTMRRRSEQYPLIPSARDAYWVAQFKSERNREAERERSNCFWAVDLSFPYSPLPFPVSFLLLLPASERRATSSSSSSHVFTCALSVGPDKLPSFSFSSPAPVALLLLFFPGACTPTHNFLLRLLLLLPPLLLLLLLPKNRPLKMGGRSLRSPSENEQ